MDNSLIIYLVIAILIVVIVISLIKKATKLIVFVLGIILILSLVNIFVYGVSPKDEINAYKTNIKYTREIAGYTSKIKTSVDNIKKIIEANNIDKNSVEILNKENINLHRYQEEIKKLEHTKKINAIHDKYCDYLNRIVATSDTSTKVANTTGIAIKGSQDILNQLKDAIEGIKGLGHF